jgi:hypothetical protein
MQEAVDFTASCPARSAIALIHLFLADKIVSPASAKNPGFAENRDSP